MPEWSNGPHSKCGVRATVPWVRIPVSPLREAGRDVLLLFASRQRFSPRLGSCSTSLRKRRPSTIRLRIPVSPQKSKPFRYLDGFLFCTFYKFTCITRSLSVHLHRVTNNNPNIICYETLLFSAFVKHVLDRASPSATLSESRVEC